MKTYMPLNGLRWSRNSGSANCDMPRSAVFGRSGGGVGVLVFLIPIYSVNYSTLNIKGVPKKRDTPLIILLWPIKG